jgi:glucosamine 6-phosphate synthetase-like amidotransferase/phosphosugar isomerase protein
MCGIAGSTNKDTAFKLYQSNLNRGFYSSGSIVLDDLTLWSCKKALGQFKEPTKPACVPGIHTEGLYYLYHSRGPTVETKGFNEENNHPFFYEDWIVAHNGIVSNFLQLTKEHYPNQDFADKTDSCIIPRMLSLFGIDHGPEKLEGTFAFWAYNVRTNNLYLVRNSCTLFANLNNGDFSSTEFEGSTALEEGKLYSIDFSKQDSSQGSRIKINCTFNFKSPYFIF